MAAHLFDTIEVAAAVLWNYVGQIQSIAEKEARSVKCLPAPLRNMKSLASPAPFRAQ